jgi:hypothetical protein
MYSNQTIGYGNLKPDNYTSGEIYQSQTLGYQPAQNYFSSSSLQNAYFGQNNYFQNKEKTHEAISDLFLAPNRPSTPLVSEFGAIKEVTEETYKQLTGQDFPHDSVKVFILPEIAFKKVFSTTGNYWNEGIQGFSLNRYGHGISEVFVRENNLDSVLLTLGHEIGHILSKPLLNLKDEEAKAHAFSIAWMNTIRDNNIAGLKPNILLNPAKNGIHDAGLEIVDYLMSAGISALDAFRTLAHGLTSKL